MSRRPARLVQAAACPWEGKAGPRLGGSATRHLVNKMENNVGLLLAATSCVHSDTPRASCVPRGLALPGTPQALTSGRNNRDGDADTVSVPTVLSWVTVMVCHLSFFSGAMRETLGRHRGKDFLLEGAPL